MRSLRRLSLGTFVAVAILLTAASAASAAMWLRITVDPAEPVVGMPTHVSVLTLVNFESGCVNEPTADLHPWWDWNGNGGKDLRFELKAFQDDRVVEIPLTRRQTDLAYWDGTVKFPTMGPWTIRVVHPLWSGGEKSGEECAGSRITVTVRPSGLPRTSTVDQGWVGVVGLVLAASTLALVASFGWRRSPLRSRPGPVAR